MKNQKEIPRQYQEAIRTEFNTAITACRRLQEQINKLSMEAVNARDKFAVYLAGVRIALMIPSTYDLTPDAASFYELEEGDTAYLPAALREPIPVGPVVIEAKPKRTVPPGEDHGDICQNNYEVYPLANS